MASSKRKALQLLELLYQHTDPAHRLTAAGIAERLQQAGIMNERKSIYRDIALLQDYGLEVKKSSTGYIMDRHILEEAEVRMLASAIQSAQFLTKSKSDALTKKLSNLLSEHQAEDVMKQCNLGSIKCANDEPYAAIETVNRAIAEHKQLDFSYYRRELNKQGAIQRRSEHFTVSPYAVIWLEDQYYMVCNINGRNDLSQFRLYHMCDVNLGQAKSRHFKDVSDYTEAFDAADYAAQYTCTFGGDPDMVTIRGTLSILDDILDRFGEDIIVKHDGDGHFKATFNATTSTAFLVWASRFGSKIEIVDPFYLRLEMKKRLEDAYALYGN